MSLYVSLDVDFWNERPLEELEYVLRRIKKLGKPLKIVNNHKKLIRHISQFNCNKVINFDEHSDIEGLPKRKLGCGNWVNYVRRDLQLSGQYAWYYPDETGGMLCDNRYEDLGELNVEQGTMWADIYEARIRDFPFGVLKSATAIGVAMSYPYLKYAEDPDFVIMQSPKYFKYIKRIQLLFRNVFGYAIPNGIHGE